MNVYYIFSVLNIIVFIFQCNMRFSCNTCPYIFPIAKRWSNKHFPKLKALDDVLGGSEAWKNVDTADESCDKCGHNKAYFMQVQTRSADEPMTTFYKCCNTSCGYRWKD